MCPIVLISQLHRSGGTLLSQLFDSHHQCRVYPGEWLHGKGPKNWPKIKNPKEDWPKISSKDNGLIYNLFGYSKGVNKRTKGETYKFDYDAIKHKKDFLKHIQNYKQERELFDCYFDTFFNSWNNHHHFGNIKFTIVFATMLTLNMSNFDNFFELYPDGFWLSLTRNPETWLSSIKKSNISRYKSTEQALDLLKTQNSNVKEAKRKFGNKLQIIKFEELIQNTHKTMSDICQILKIDFSDSLLFPTFNKQPISANSAFPNEKQGIIKEPLNRQIEIKDKILIGKDIQEFDQYSKIIVQPGDSLSNLFKEHWNDIYYDDKNELLRKTSPNPNMIQPGQIIYVKNKYIEENYHLQSVLENPYRQVQKWNNLSGIEKFKKAIKQLKLKVSSCLENELENSINQNKKYYLYSTHSTNGIKSDNQLDGLTIEFNPENLLKKIQTTELSCYWVAIEPFNFFLDIDDTKENLSLDRVSNIISKYFNEYLVCSTDPITEKHFKKMRSIPEYWDYPRHRVGYSIFTKQKVTYDEAIEMEKEIASQFSKSIVNRFDSNCYYFPSEIVDPMFATMSPLVFKRTPFSTHGWYKDRISYPRINVSKIPNMSDLDLFLYSNPNDTKTK